MKILVIGETCLDKYIYCKIERLSPEAPVPVVLPQSSKMSWGMASNVINNLNSLGITNTLLLDPNTQISKTRYVDSQSGYIVLRVDENDTVNPNYRLTFEKFIRYITEDKYDAVVVSDYNKGFLTEDILAEIGKYCYENHIVSFIDTKKMLGIWSQNYDFVKINLKEFNDQMKNCVTLDNWYKNLIVTMGKDGSKWVNKGDISPVQQINVSDTSGCGDSYLAGFVVKYMETKNVVKSMEYGNKVARIAASKHGVVAVNKEEVE